MAEHKVGQTAGRTVSSRQTFMSEGDERTSNDFDTLRNLQTRHGLWPTDIDELAAASFSVYSPETLRSIEQVQDLLSQATPILFTGEAGTGKTRAARLIHEMSPRKGEPFLVVDCNALSPSLIESEMFGHVKGAFTGANRDRIGKFAAVGEGTLVLDEINSLPLDLQSKLLPVVVERVFKPVGTNQSVPLLARLVMSANVDLEQEVAAGRFRADLYYRLKVLTFYMSPLRERVSAIGPLAHEFLAKFAAANRVKKRGITSEALRALEAYPWPGNIRELGKVIERAITLFPGPMIELAHLPEALRSHGVLRAGGACPERGYPVISLEDDSKRVDIARDDNVEAGIVGGPLPSPKTVEEGLHREFDELVASIAAEREGQAARVQQVLNEYLRRWDEEQQSLTRQRKSRPAEEIAQAKKELVERVNAALERLDMSIYRGGLPCNLTVPVDKDHRRGTFWLTPRGMKKPVDHKANLSDLFSLGQGEPEIGVAPPRREAFVEWRAKVKASQRSNRSK